MRASVSVLCSNIYPFGFERQTFRLAYVDEPNESVIFRVITLSVVMLLPIFVVFAASIGLFFRKLGKSAVITGVVFDAVG